MDWLGTTVTVINNSSKSVSLITPDSRTSGEWVNGPAGTLTPGQATVVKARWDGHIRAVSNSLRG